MKQREEYVAALEAGLLLAGFSAFVHWAPPRATSRLLTRLGPGLGRVPPPFQTREHRSPADTPVSGASAEHASTARDVERAVRRAGRLVPAHTCLSRALTAFVMLRRRRQSAELRLGAARSDAGTLQVHAWVEADGRTLLDAPGAERMSPFREAR